ncbi:MAG: hypothetical protein AB8G14_08355 [Ilumatobacter sp.]
MELSRAYGEVRTPEHPLVNVVLVCVAYVQVVDTKQWGGHIVDSTSGIGQALTEMV